jgi:hypothetical protein
MLVELRLENGEIHTRRLARSLRRCGQRNSRVLLRTNGLSEPILLYEGTILDGRAWKLPSIQFFKPTAAAIHSQK